MSEVHKPLLIDATILNDELDMLEFRMRLLWDKVDKFVVVESDREFSGKAKPYHLKGNLARFEWAKEKLVPYQHKASTKGLALDEPPTEYDPTHDCWQIEYQQRNAIADAIKVSGSDDIVLLGDVDEIPSKEAINSAMAAISSFPMVFKQAFFYYDLTNLRNEIWNGTIITTPWDLRKDGAQAMRDKRNSLNGIYPGGWHFSYFGGKEAIKRKVQAFSHQELNTPEFKDDVHIEGCLQSGADLFKRQVRSYKVGKGYYPGYLIQEVKINEWWGK